MRLMHLVALLVPLLILSACEKPETVEVSLPIVTDLETLTVKPSTVTRETVLDGTLEAVNRSTVSAQTSGRIEELPFDVGDLVEAGDLIVRITDTEQQAQVNRAQAAVAEAEAQLAQAAANLKRIQQIYDQRLIAKAELDAAVSSRDSGQARLNAATAAQQQAEQELGYTEVIAPFAGIVVEKMVDIGEAVSAGTPLMAGLSLEHLRAAVDVPQQHMAAVRDPGKARIILPDGRSIDASGLRLPPNADPDSGTFSVRANLPPGDYDVFPGTFVKVAFLSGEEQALSLPESALARRGEVTGVYVLDEHDQLQFRYVRTGSSDAEGRVSILSGLQEGERVVQDALAGAQRYKGLELQ